MTYTQLPPYLVKHRHDTVVMEVHNMHAVREVESLGREVVGWLKEGVRVRDESWM